MMKRLITTAIVLASVLASGCHMEKQKQTEINLTDSNPTVKVDETFNTLCQNLNEGYSVGATVELSNIAARETFPDKTEKSIKTFSELMVYSAVKAKCPQHTQALEAYANR